MTAAGLDSTPGYAAALALASRVEAASPAQPAPQAAPAPQQAGPRLTDEQQAVVDAALTGRDVIVDSVAGSGKTTTIQELSDQLADRGRSVLYLTYSKLLKLDAKKRVKRARTVQNYHGVVYPPLMREGIRTSISESIETFNRRFADVKKHVLHYDVIVIDEYQDIVEEYGELLRRIRGTNPDMQVVLVGDREQKVKSDTLIDIEEFVRHITRDPIELALTQSFRIGQDLADLLGRAWGKQIVGANPDHRVRTVSPSKAVREMLALDPSELMVLGSRRGGAAKALNELEERAPEKFNKGTVYASIKDRDGGVEYGDDVAVFTTYDSSKGLERPRVYVYDFDESFWNMRLGMPNTDPEVLRNIFLVAASRGKEEVVFVKSDSPKARAAVAKAVEEDPTRASMGMLGGVPVKRFVELPQTTAMYGEEPIFPSDCFEFKYVEMVESCTKLIDMERLDDGASPVIEVDRTDGLIDLSPAIGRYQEAQFFEGWDARDELDKMVGKDAQEMAAELEHLVTGDPWKDALLVTAVDTGQKRYVDQVTKTVPDDVKDRLVERLSTQLRPRTMHQDRILMEALLMSSPSRGQRAEPVLFAGAMDAVEDGVVYELKFVTELSRTMFLQLALYLVMSGLEEGVLWNTRTDERWRVTIPVEMRQAFVDQVAKTITKGRQNRMLLS